jgi:hypothetical protein
MTVRDAGIEARAIEARDAFNNDTRPDGEEFVKLKHDHPDWVLDAVRKAHAGALPDDWLFKTCREAFAELVECIKNGEDLDSFAAEFADSVDDYTAQLLKYAARNAASSFIEQAREEGLVTVDSSLDERIRAGQYMERQDVAEAILRACREAEGESEDE